MSYVNSVAIQATLHCLTGCAIGEVVGMVIATALSFDNLLQILFSTLLAFVFGYSLTMIPLIKHGLSLKAAIGLALAADTVSILVMEITDNGFIAIVPGALDAGLNTVLFWLSLSLSLVVAFVFAVPTNGWLISRGKGHAVVHEVHHHS